MASLTDEELQQLRSAPPPDELSGWVELVELSRLYLQEPDMLVDAVEAVVVGKYDPAADVFEAEELLMKCPSKYEEKE